MVTVKQLRELIANLPDDTEVYYVADLAYVKAVAVDARNIHPLLPQTISLVIQ